jgi:hypothetical protein
MKYFSIQCFTAICQISTDYEVPREVIMATCPGRNCCVLLSRL